MLHNNLNNIDEWEKKDRYHTKCTEQPHQCKTIAKSSYMHSYTSTPNMCKCKYLHLCISIVTHMSVFYQLIME